MFAGTRPDRTHRRGSALPRLPLLLACATLLIAAYTVVSARLAPRLFPGLLDRQASPGPAATPELASLRAIEGILGAVQQAVRDGEIERARTIVDRAVGQYPRDQALHLARADLLYRLAYPESGDDLPEPARRGYLSQAYESYLAALEIGPREPETEFAAGSIARTLGNLDPAIAHFSAAASGDQTIAAYPLNLAQVHLSRGDLDQAQAQLAVSISIDPDQPTAWGMLAEIALRQNEPRLAVQHLEKAVGLEPIEPAWRHMQARAYNRLPDAESALRCLDALPPADRFGKVSLQLAGQSYGLLRQPDKALALYEEALASEPGQPDPEVLLDAAAWAERLGQPQRALELARRAHDRGLDRAEPMIRRLEARPENGGG